MNFDSNSRKYYWIIIVIGVFIGLLSLLFPTATGDRFYLGELIESLDIWMVGYVRYYWWQTGKESYWMNNPDYETVNLISSIPIILILIFTLIGTLLTRKRKSSYISLISGISLTGFAIYYMVGLDLNMEGVWDELAVGFGIIGIFLSSVLIITGFVVGFTDYFDKIRKPIQPTSEEIPIILKQEPIISASSTHIGKIKFCPECGNKLSKADQKFCMECGTAI